MTRNEDLTVRLHNESVARSKQLRASQDAVESGAIHDHVEYERERAEVGPLGEERFYRSGGIQTGLRALRMVDSAIDQLEYLREELVAVLIGGRDYQTERAPELMALSAELGELKVLLKVQHDENEA